jgi:hypothetical protein
LGSTPAAEWSFLVSGCGYTPGRKGATSAMCAAAGKRIEAETTLTFDLALRLSPLFEVPAG